MRICCGYAGSGSFVATGDLAGVVSNIMDRIDFSILNPEQRSIVFLIYCAELSEQQAANELNEWWGGGFTRDRVHTVRRSAERPLRRRADELGSV